MTLIDRALGFANRLYEKRIGKPEMKEVAPASTSTSAWAMFVGEIMMNPDRVLSSTQAEGKGLELYQEMIDKDPQIASCFRTRKKAVLNKPWEIVPATDKNRDQRIAEFVQMAFRYPRRRESWAEMLDCVPKGVAMTEILWGHGKGDEVIIGDIRGRDPTRFVFDKDYNLRLKTQAAPWVGEPVPDRKFLVVRNEPVAENPYGNALCKELFWYYWGKKWAIKFWNLRMERFASPHVKAKIPENASDKQKAAIYDLLDKWQNQTAFAIPEGFELDFLEALSRGEVGYLPWIQYCDDADSRTILGQTLSSSEGRRSGSLALGEVHAEVRYEYLADDCELLMDAINHQLIPWLVDFNYFNVDEYPRLVIHYEPEEDLMNEAKKDKTLFVEIGLPVTKEHLYEKYGVPQPQEDQELLEVPVRGGGLPFSDRGKKKLLTFAGKKKYQIGSTFKVRDKLYDQVKRIIASMETEYIDILQSNQPLGTALEELIRTKYRKQLENAVNGATYDAIRLGANSMADQLNLKINKDVFGGLFENYLSRRAYEKGTAVDMADSLRELLSSKAQALLEEKLSAADLAAKIKGIFPELADWKAKQIAVTEVASAADWAGTQMVKESGLAVDAYFLVDPESCDDCQDLAIHNPYTVAQAEELGLPHPNCNDQWAFILKENQNV